jgi:uncharacterized Tic20 family protein
MELARVDERSRNLAALVHLASYSSFVLPWFAPFLVPVVAIALGPADPYVRQHAYKELDFQISYLLWISLALLFSLVLVGIPFLLVLLVMYFVTPLANLLSASQGAEASYPLALPIFSSSRAPLSVGSNANAW